MVIEICHFLKSSTSSSLMTSSRNVFHIHITHFEKKTVLCKIAYLLNIYIQTLKCILRMHFTDMFKLYALYLFYPLTSCA